MVDIFFENVKHEENAALAGIVCSDEKTALGM